MFSDATNTSGKKSSRRGRSRGVAVLCLLGGMALGGCASMDLRGEPFPKDETFDWTGETRPADGQVDFFGFSNKARQIERDFGAR